MVSKELAQKLLPLVNDTEVMRDLQLYIASRIAFLKDELATAKTFEEVRAMQGAIKELNRFKTLRDEIITGSRYNGD